jgi:hypothetical protein
MKAILSGPFYLGRSIWAVLSGPFYLADSFREGLIQTSGGRLNGYAQITIKNRLIERI